MEEILLMTKSFYSCMFFLTQEILTSLTRATRDSILMTYQRPSVSQNFDSGNETPPNLPKSCKFLRQSHAAKDLLAMGYRGPLHAFETLSFPCRYGDMIQRFARLVPVLCMVTNTVLDFI